MPTHRKSFLKTTWLAIAASVAAIAVAAAAAALLSGAAAIAIAIAAALLAIAAGAVAAGGALVLWRDRLESRNVDLFLRFNTDRDEAALAVGGRFRRTWSRGLVGLLRKLSGEPYLVGDEVEVRPFDEVRGTLDAQGCLDGLPFLPEMAGFCGRRMRVFRCVDKLYDYGGKKDLRRIRRTVLLTGLRCDGSAHGGCQARCYLLWKTAWLRPARDAADAATSAPAAASPAPEAAAVLPAGGPERWVCQYTQVVASSAPLCPRDPRQDLRPLLAGNLTLRAFAVAILTRVFNRAQALRGGAVWPHRDPGTCVKTPVVDLGLRPGERVRVRDKSAIAATLDARGRNRGMWFENDMLKHCGRVYPVLDRVERIIDDATGRMMPMKTPCIVLEHVYTSGEILRFCAQHDLTFWREAWLERAEDGARGGDGASRA